MKSWLVWLIPSLHILNITEFVRICQLRSVRSLCEKCSGEFLEERVRLSGKQLPERRVLEEGFLSFVKTVRMSTLAPSQQHKADFRLAPHLSLFLALLELLGV